MSATIGITGEIASGKETVVQYFLAHGFFRFSLSDEVRNEALREGLLPERENLQNLGDALRNKFGSAVLAERIMKDVIKMRRKNEGALIVIDSIRNPDECRLLRGYGAKIIGITAPFETRYNRVLNRNKDKTIWGKMEFKKADSRDRGIGQNSFGNNVRQCFSFADVIIKNDGSIEELYIKLDKILDKLMKPI
jgi:dephospho-CoA kinase